MPCSTGAIGPILRKAGCGRRRKKPRLPIRSLAVQKMAGPAFGLLQMHVTDPSDLDGYRELIPLGPPRYHYTARTVADGALRLAFNKTRGGPTPQGNVSQLSIDGAPIG